MMDVQNFVGDSMRDALTQVRESLGEDALILDTKETSRGIEVAAVAESPGGIVIAPPRAAAPVDSTSVAADAVVPDPQGSARIDAALARVTDKIADQSAVKEEMQSLRSLVESHLAHVGWSETSLGSPLKASVMRNLSALGIAPDLVSSFLAEVDTERLRGKTWAVPMRLLEEKLPVVDIEAAGATRIAVVGPTGAGKTTTIAKLAARHAIQTSADKLDIVSLDNHRLGSSEQIDALGRLLGVAVRRPVGDRGLDDLTALSGEAELTLIDTVGLGQHDARIAEQLGRLGDDVCTLLVLPANLEHDAMQEVVDAWSVCKPAGIVLTKVDEAATLGAAISVIVRSGIPLAYICDGERIPEDLRKSVDSQARLVKQAVELMRRRRISVSERYMAENFFSARQEETVSHER